MASGYRVGDIHPTVEKKMESVNKRGTCGCGRSPTGNCIGWHSLEENEYREKLAGWELEDYKRKANQLWNDSCTSGKSE
jgi:hypothetical protein